MSKNNVIEFEGREANTDPLNERLQAGVRKRIHQAVEAERYAQLEQYADLRPPSYQTLKGLPLTRWYAAYDVQAGYVCGEKMASSARL